LPYVDFDEDFFIDGVRALNKTAPVIKVSCKTGEGFDEVMLWIKEKAKHNKENNSFRNSSGGRFQTLCP